MIEARTFASSPSVTLGYVIQNQPTRETEYKYGSIYYLHPISDHRLIGPQVTTNDVNFSLFCPRNWVMI